MPFCLRGAFSRHISDLTRPAPLRLNRNNSFNNYTSFRGQRVTRVEIVPSAASLTRCKPDHVVIYTTWLAVRSRPL
jgi:hypothetical protein